MSVGLTDNGGVSITLDAAELSRAVQNIAKWTTEREKKIVAVINSVGVRVESEAKLRAPVNKQTQLGDKKVGGELRASIHSTVARKVTDPVFVSTDVEYAAFVEFGTGRRGAASGTKPPKGYVHGAGKKRPNSAGMRAQPYLVPAMEANRRVFVERLRKALEAK